MASHKTVTTILIAALVGSGCGFIAAKLNSKQTPSAAVALGELQERVASLAAELRQLKTLLAKPSAAPVRAELAAVAPPPQNPEQSLVSVPESDEFNPEIEVVDEPDFSPRDYKRKMLSNGGFSEEEISWVLQSEAEVNLQALIETYQYRRQAYQEAKAKGQLRPSEQELLRAKLGDENYARYLAAQGAPTAPRVGQVLAGSPADNAGLQVGDRIKAYAGNRVFQFRDITRLTVEGVEGESVLLEIERDGSPLQITLPRGPIGIVGGG